MWKFLEYWNKLCLRLAWALFICTQAFHSLQTVDEVLTPFALKKLPTLQLIDK